MLAYRISSFPSLGTWLSAAVYHNENYDAVCNVVKDLDPKDAESIEKAQDLLEDPAVKEELEFVILGQDHYFKDLDHRSRSIK